MDQHCGRRRCCCYPGDGLRGRTCRCPMPCLRLDVSVRHGNSYPPCIER